MAQRTVSIVIEVAGADEAVQQVRRMRSALDDLAGGGAESMDQVLRQSREATQAMKEMEKSFDLRKQQREMIGDLEDFFRRILSGARTTGDVFKNIWREIAEFFRRAVREMAAAWTLNLGGVSPLLSGLPFSSLGLPGLDAGRLPAAVPTLASTLGFPATVPLGDILARLPGVGPFSGGSALLGGLGLAAATIGSPNRVVSTLGGFLGGGFAGLATGLAFGGPIGAIVGGLIGLFTGGGGQQKRRDAAIAEQGFAQLAQILDDYNHFRRDFASAVDASNRIWSQMQSQWLRPQSAPSQRPYFDAILRSLQATEDERNRRRQLLSLMPVPEFQFGGLVMWGQASGLSRQAGMPALLHPGEFVMNRQAVERIGWSALEGMNASEPRPAGSGLEISLEPASAQTLGDMLRKNPQALEEGLLVVLRRGGAASRALRG